jgi:hypothetical protein
MELLYTATLNKDLDNAHSIFECNNIFTTEYHTYKIFIRAVGNQSTYKQYRLMNASGQISTVTYAADSIHFRSSGAANTDGAASVGGMMADVHTLRDIRFQPGIVFTVFNPADANYKTVCRVEGISDYDANYITFESNASREVTLQAVTGFTYNAYGIGEDIEGMQIEVYGIK